MRQRKTCPKSPPADADFAAEEQHLEEAVAGDAGATAVAATARLQSVLLLQLKYLIFLTLTKHLPLLVLLLVLLVLLPVLGRPVSWLARTSRAAP